MPSARATSSIGRQGMLIPVTPARRSGLPRTAARPWRAVWTGRATSTVGLFRHRRHHSFTRGGWFESSGSSRTAGQSHRIWSRPSVAFPRPTRVLQHAVPPSRGRRAGSIRQRVTRHVRSERLARSRVVCSGVTIAGVTARRSAGCSGVGSFSAIGVGESLARLACPTCEWSRRARPSCAILSPRRAAHSHRWAD